MLLSASWVLPFLQPFHAPPLPAFFSEWLAIALSLAAVMCLLCARKLSTMAWHGPITVTLLAMAVLILLQWAAGMVPYAGVAALGGLYLLWAVALMSVSATLSARLGLERSMSTLAWALAGAGLLNAAIIVAQCYRLPTGVPFLIYPSPDGQYFGNIGQKNHFAHVMTLSMASIIYLLARDRMTVWVAGACLAAMTFAASLTASRSLWVFVVALAVLACSSARGAPRGPLHDRVVRMSILSIGLVVLWNIVLPLLDARGIPLQTAGERVLPAVEHRPVFWREAWQMFLDHPFAGVGFGRFGAEYYAMQLNADVATGLTMHAHNIVLQVAAESGGAGLLILVALIISLARRLPWTGNGPEGWWLLGVLSVSALHSMVEYPLWYAYFLGIAAVVAGMAVKPTGELRLTGRARWVMLAALCGVLVNMTWTAVSYARLEQVLTIPGLYSENAYETLREGLRDPLLRPHAEWTVASVMAVDRKDIDYKLRLNARVMDFMPSDEIAYQKSYLLALAGRREESLSSLRHALKAYPDERRAALVRMRYLAAKDPLPFLPLLELARQDGPPSASR